MEYFVVFHSGDGVLILQGNFFRNLVSKACPPMSKHTALNLAWNVGNSDPKTTDVDAI